MCSTLTQYNAKIFTFFFKKGQLLKWSEIQGLSFVVFKDNGHLLMVKDYLLVTSNGISLVNE